MKRRVVTTLCATAALAAVWSRPVRADEEPKRVRPQPQRPARGEGFDPAALVQPRLLEALRLTDEQKEKFEKLKREFEEKNKDAFAKSADEIAKAREAMQKAREAQDREAAQKAGEQMREAMQASMKLRSEFEPQFTAILTDEQKRTYEQSRRGGAGAGGRGGPGGVLSPQALERLNLTDEQKEQVRKLQQELQEKQAELFRAMQKQREEIEAKVQALLNDEQKKTFEELKKNAAGAGRRGNPGERPAERPERKRGE